jgi:glycosyltransferase involved in cell wall biosynthesis
MIAYHYPPVQGSSGVHRTLQFSRYLFEHGWRPLVLTVHPRAYEETGSDLLKAIDARTVVKRAFALDTARHLAIGGRYPRFLAVPDRWRTWWIGGVVSGLRLVRRHRPSVLWSTFPIATAHSIGLTLQRRTGLPWVADFRDSMTEPHYPRDAVVRQARLRIEEQTVRACARAVFTTAGAARMYAERYPDIPPERWAVLPNGYDEETFRDAEERLGRGPGTRGPLVLVHSGVLYPAERDPSAFFRAIASLKADGAFPAQGVRVVLRASGHDGEYRATIAGLGIEDVVHLEPSLPYRGALEEMLRADGLLLFQSAGCNHQIPAKLYEYLRAKRPVFAMTDARGDTAGELRKAGLTAIVPLDDADAIRDGLARFLADLREGRAAVAAEDFVQSVSRRALTAELARLLDAVT